MKLIFVRHGPKVRDEKIPDAELPLSPIAGEQAQLLRTWLAARGLTPKFIVSSRYAHALESAELLRAKRTRQVIPVTALTPHTLEAAFTMTTILSEAMAANVDLLRDCDVLMLVGHETRLSQLAGHLLPDSPTLEQLPPFGALIVDWCGRIEERFPV